jgi:hypothetical protein
MHLQVELYRGVYFEQSKRVSQPIATAMAEAVPGLESGLSATRELWMGETSVYTLARSGDEGCDRGVKPLDARLMRCFPVSTRINHVANDDEECSAPVELAQIQDRLFTL